MDPASTTIIVIPPGSTFSVPVSPRGALLFLLSLSLSLSNELSRRLRVLASESKQDVSALVF